MEEAAEAEGKTVSQLMQEAAVRYLNHRGLDRLVERGQKYAAVSGDQRRDRDLDFTGNRSGDSSRILECAETSRSNFIVTEDKDLLWLGIFGEISILTASQFLAEPRLG